MDWVRTESPAGPELKRSCAGRIVGIGNNPEIAKVIIAVETASGMLVAVSLTPREGVFLKLDLYQGIENNKQAQTSVEACIAGIEGEEEYKQWSAD